MRRPDTAVILAAGRGTRLGAMGKDVPKGFLQVGERPIVEDSIARLAAFGVERVVIVTGHLAHFYDGLASRSDGLVETIHNDVYADSGSFYSLSLVRGHVKPPFLLLESDLVYESRALAEVAAPTEENVLLLSAPTGSGDEVWVEADEPGRLVRMSKDRGALAVEPAGELVGITLVGGSLWAELGRQAEELLGRTRNVEYEAGGIVAAAGSCSIHCHVVRDLVWMEIDDEAQLEKARALPIDGPAMAFDPGRESRE